MTDWTKKWPTERGWYWFYGQTSAREWPIRLVPVWVAKDGSKPSYIREGRLLLKREGARGLWSPAVSPGIPSDSLVSEVFGIEPLFKL